MLALMGDARCGVPNKIEMSGAPVVALWAGMVSKSLSLIEPPQSWS